MLWLAVAWDVIKSYWTDAVLRWRRCRYCKRVHQRGQSTMDEDEYR